MLIGLEHRDDGNVVRVRPPCPPPNQQKQSHPQPTTVRPGGFFIGKNTAERNKMEIITVERRSYHYIETDESEFFNYVRYSPDCWMVRMGESDEPMYDCEGLEAAFIEKQKTDEPSIKDRILQEMDFVTAIDEPVGFLALTMLGSELLGRVVPTVIEIAGVELSEEERKQVRDHISRLGAILVEAHERHDQLEEELLP